MTVCPVPRVSRSGLAWPPGALALGLALLMPVHADADDQTVLADVADVSRFRAVSIAPSTQPRPWAANPASGFRLPRSLSYDGEELDFEAMLERSGTLGWIVVWRGEVVDERYFGGADAAALLTSFSIAKSLVGALVAIARQRGEVPDRDTRIEPASTLPAALRTPPLRWRDLLDMRAGLAFSEDYARDDSDVARLYLATDLSRALAGIQRSRGRPQFHYDSASTQLLTEALQGAVGLRIDQQLQQRIWQPMGAATEARWSTDEAEPAHIKGFCCFSASLQDYARFGQAVLDAAAGRPSPLPQSWVGELLAAANSGETYRDQWWLLHDPKGGPEATALLAQGVLGQYLFVHPQAELVVVRLAKAEDAFPWKTLFGALVAENRSATP